MRWQAEGPRHLRAGWRAGYDFQQTASTRRLLRKLVVV
jgi:hypothetical protein